MSSTFYPGNHCGPPRTVEDLVFVSSDRVSFCLHSEVVLAASSNAFDNLVDPLQVSAARAKADHHVVAIPETASVLNIILHAIYGLSCQQFDPTNDDLFAAVDAFQRTSSPGCPLPRLTSTCLQRGTTCTRSRHTRRRTCLGARQRTSRWRPPRGWGRCTSASCSPSRRNGRRR